MKHILYHPLTLLITLAFIISNLHLATPFSWNGIYQLKDLELNGATFVSSEAPSWSVSNYFPGGGHNVYYNCAGTYMIGGYKVLGNGNSQYLERTYSGLPSHNQINMKLTLYALDNWNGNVVDDHFEFQFDGVNYYGWKLYGVTGYSYQYCGNSLYSDYPPIRVTMSIPHYALSLKFRIVSFLTQGTDIESFGIRDIVMDFVNVTSPAFSLCGTANGAPLPDKLCPCPATNMYMSPANSGTCYACNSACMTCTGPLNTDCTSCYDGTYLSGSQCLACASTCATCNGGTTTSCLTCKTASPYLINNNQCVVDCHSPLSTGTNNGTTTCYTPCPGQYVLWDSQCSSVCTSIFLTQRTYNTFSLCDYPCADNQYLYWDGVCDSQCLQPATIRDFHGKNYCDHTCAITTDYLYWDAQCEGTCAYPLVNKTIHRRGFCEYPCANSEYLYWDSYCGTTCPSPLVTRISHTNQFCDFPCSTGQFLYWNASCIAACDSPYIPRSERGVNYCDFPCSSIEYLYWNNTCLPTCPTPLTTRVNGDYTFCDYPCQATEILHWNGSCIADCASPRSYREEGSPMVRRFCDYPCATTQYLYWNSTCQDSCVAPLMMVFQESRNFCEYPCTTNEYLYWNGSCQNFCSTPFVSRVENSLNYCDYPCSGSDFLYWNGSCLSSCASPLVQSTTDGKYYCDYPCQTSEYLYWDSQCRSSCDFPLSYRLEAGQNYCDYPCTGSDYLYWNGSCIGTCTLFTPRTDMGKYFCDFQCATTDYIYWDRACSSTCESPLTSHTEGNPMVRNFCDFPCDSSEYLYWNSTCSSSCDSPLSGRTQNSRQFCSAPCPAGEYLYWNGSCKATCSLPLVTRVEGSQNYCDYPCSGSEYLYWNGSCLDTCNAPLAGSLVEGNYFCDFPCDMSYYLYWNGTCDPSCSDPLIAVTEGTPSRNFCSFGCSSNEYLYNNETCLPICDFPLINTTIATRHYCYYPCNTDQYLYWNQDCNASCPFPYITRVESSLLLNYCDFPCMGSDILYWNTSCLATCPFPLTTRYENNKVYCDYHCDTSEYLYWNGSCLSSCDSPLSFRLEAGQNYCDYPCSSSEFLFWNGSCSSTCNAPLTERTVLDASFCDYPCAPDEFLYWDGTCSSTCLSPLTQLIEGETILRKYCTFPCTSPTDYLYWNGTCQATCNAPLATSTQNGKLFCNYPCDLSEYLFWDGFCSPDCPVPLTTRVEGATKYCDFGCESSEYLYYNGTCSRFCDSLFNSRLDRGMNFCDFPCADIEYLYWNGTCDSGCTSPFISRIETSIVVRQFCNLPCGTTGYFGWNGQCLSSCEAPLITNTSSPIQSCVLPCTNTSEYYYVDQKTCKEGCVAPYVITQTTPYLECSPGIPEPSEEPEDDKFDVLLGAPVGSGAFSLIQVVKPMKYLRFLDIKLPPRLERLGSSKGKTLLSFHSGSRRLDSSGATDALSFMFTRQNIGTNFIDNYLGTFIFIVSAVVGAVVFSLLERLSRRYQWEIAEEIFKRFRVITKWNLGVMLLATNIDDVILYAFIEFRADVAVTNYFSMTLCVIFIGLTTISLYGMFLLARRHKQFKSTKSDLTIFERKWEDFQIIFRGFKDDKPLNIYFYLIYTIRIGFPMFIVACAPKVPLFITLVQLLASVGIMVYLLKMKPFQKKINQVQLMIYEGVVLMMNSCMLLLTIFSISENDGGDVSVVLGDIVIVGNDSLNFVAVIFFTIRCVMEAKAIRRYIRARNSSKAEKRLERTLYLQLFALFFQQCNMGFEEMIEDNPSFSMKPIRKEDGDIKSAVSEKTEVLRTDSIIYSKKREKVSPMLSQEDGIYENTRQNSFPETTDRYRTLKTESTRGSKPSDRLSPTKEDYSEDMNMINLRYQQGAGDLSPIASMNDKIRLYIKTDDQLSPNKEDYYEDLNTTSPRYRHVVGDLSPIMSTNENMQLYSFRPPREASIRVEKQDEVADKLESLTLFRKDLTRHSRVNSQSISPGKTPEESVITVSQREGEEPLAIFSLDHHTAPAQTRLKDKKMMRYLGYNFNDVSASGTLADLSQHDLSTGTVRQYHDFKVFEGFTNETERFDIPTSKDQATNSHDNSAIFEYRNKDKSEKNKRSNRLWSKKANRRVMPIVE